MRQITIVTESRRGLTADIAKLLAAADINIETLDAEEVEGADVGTLSVDHYNRALAALRDAGYPAEKTGLALNCTKWIEFVAC